MVGHLDVWQGCLWSILDKDVESCRLKTLLCVCMQHYNNNNNTNLLFQIF